MRSVSSSSFPNCRRAPHHGGLISPGSCDLSGGNSASSQIQIQRFKGVGVKWVEKLQDAPSVDCTEIQPSVECFPVYPSGLTDSLLQQSAVLHAYWATAWTQPSGPWKGPWSPGWMVIVSRSVLTAFQASELIKTPKGSNPWMPLRDLQLLLFMN